jgi:hypothetical protein
MKEGNLVKFNKVPTRNTPGAPTRPYDLYSGVVVREFAKSDCAFEKGIGYQPQHWVEVMWTNNEVTMCYKQDLKVVMENKENA